jgi:hypothetical protein
VHTQTCSIAAHTVWKQQGQQQCLLAGQEMTRGPQAQLCLQQLGKVHRAVEKQVAGQTQVTGTRQQCSSHSVTTGGTAAAMPACWASLEASKQSASNGTVVQSHSGTVAQWYSRHTGMPSTHFCIRIC